MTFMYRRMNRSCLDSFAILAWRALQRSLIPIALPDCSLMRMQLSRDVFGFSNKLVVTIIDDVIHCILVFLIVNFRGSE